MVKLKKGQKLACVPCGREVVISNCGVARSTIWCCSKPMKEKTTKKKMPVEKKQARCKA